MLVIEMAKTIEDSTIARAKMKEGEKK